jgi:hypothetical protein
MAGSGGQQCEVSNFDSASWVAFKDSNGCYGKRNPNPAVIQRVSDNAAGRI